MDNDLDSGGARALLWLRRIGGLRLALLFGTILLLALVPAPGTPAVYSGWRMIGTVLLPVITPLVFMVLLLDALMTRIFLVDATGGAHRRFKTILAIDLLAALALLIRWLPYYAALRV